LTGTRSSKGTPHLFPRRWNTIPFAHVRTGE